MVCLHAQQQFAYSCICLGADGSALRLIGLAGPDIQTEVLVIDKDAPVLEISGNSAEWTNKDIILTARANEGIIEYFNGSEWLCGSTMTVTENGTYRFRVTDIAGNVTEKSVIVDKIDKTAAPVPEIVNISDMENKITVDWSDVADAGSGIAVPSISARLSTNVLTCTTACLTPVRTVRTWHPTQRRSSTAYFSRTAGRISRYITSKTIPRIRTRFPT